MIVYFVKIFIGIVLIFISSSSIVSDSLKPELCGGGIILLIDVFLIDFTSFLYNNWNRVKLILHCKYLSIWNTSIRFSMSYLYRIKVDDHWLLVKSTSFSHYQHVGGKYKRLSLTQKILNDFEAIDDLKMPTCGLKKDDMAIFIPAKNAIKFIDWFNTGKDREVSHWREFYEELIDGKAQVLNPKIFSYVNYNHIGTVITPLKIARPWPNCKEILQYDILDLIPTPDQENELRNLFLKGDSDYIKWADNELIQNDGHDCRTKNIYYKIGEHTKWALNLKWSK